MQWIEELETFLQRHWTPLLALLSFALGVFNLWETRRKRFERRRVRAHHDHRFNQARDHLKYDTSLQHLSRGAWRVKDGDHCFAVEVRYNGPTPNRVIAIGFRMADDRNYGTHYQEKPRELRDGYRERYLIPHRTTSELRATTHIVVHFEHGGAEIVPVNWPWRLKLWYMDRLHRVAPRLHPRIRRLADKVLSLGRAKD